LRSSKRRISIDRRSPVAGHLDATLREGGVEQTQDVKLVGDEACVRKRAAREALVGVAHVERDEADVLRALDVCERGLELVDGSAVDELEEAVASDVDDHRDEVART
jgi:hypothetical protein